MQIAEFDREAAELVTASVKEVLAAVAAKHGVRIDVDRVTYRSRQCSITLAVATVQAGTDGLSREAEAFKMGASFFGLTPEHLGQTFRDENGLRFKLVGLNVKARKRPFIVADVTGKEYACGEETVLRGFGVAPRKET